MKKTRTIKDTENKVTITQLTQEEIREHLSKEVKITPFNSFSPCVIGNDNKIDIIAQAIADVLEPEVMKRVREILIDRITKKI